MKLLKTAPWKNLPRSTAGFDKPVLATSLVCAGGGLVSSVYSSAEASLAAPGLFAASVGVGAAALMAENFGLVQQTTRRRLAFGLLSNSLNAGQFTVLALAGNASSLNAIGMSMVSVLRKSALFCATDKNTGACSLSAGKKLGIVVVLLGAGSAFFAHRLGAEGFHDLSQGRIGQHMGELCPWTASVAYALSDVMERHRYGRILKSLGAGTNIYSGFWLTGAFTHAAGEISGLVINLLAASRHDMPPHCGSRGLLKPVLRKLKGYVAYLRNLKEDNIHPERRTAGKRGQVSNGHRDAALTDQEIEGLKELGILSPRPDDFRYLKGVLLPPPDLQQIAQRLQGLQKLHDEVQFIQEKYGIGFEPHNHEELERRLHEKGLSLQGEEIDPPPDGPPLDILAWGKEGAARPAAQGAVPPASSLRR